MASRSARTRPPATLPATGLVRGCGCSFFGIFFIFGLAFAGFAAWTVLLPEWRANTQYVEHTCTVLGKRVAESHDSDGVSYRPEVHIRYTVNGRVFEAWTYDASQVSSSGRAAKQAIIDGFVVGRQYPCWYDPDDPAKAVLVRGYSWFLWIFIGGGLLFAAIGAAGMVYTWRYRGKSPERRAALEAAKRSEGLDSADRVEEVECPNVPDPDRDPGEVLAHRLSNAEVPAAAVGCGLAFCLVWNAGVGFWLYTIVQGHRRGQPDWFQTLFITPFVLAGLAVTGYLVKQIMVWAGVGRTRVEVSANPVRPGEAFEVLVVQPGRLRMNSLRVLLRCVEKATYREGTDTRTETRTVHETELAREEDFWIEKGAPHEVRRKARVPTTAMHSFEAKNNEVVWKVVVEGDVAGWPDFSRDFPLTVLPAAEGGAS